jgi:hypothetical protein
MPMTKHTPTPTTSRTFTTSLFVFYDHNISHTDNIHTYTHAHNLSPGGGGTAVMGGPPPGGPREEG